MWARRTRSLSSGASEWLGPALPFAQPAGDSYVCCCCRCWCWDCCARGCCARGCCGGRCCEGLLLWWSRCCSTWMPRMHRGSAAGKMMLLLTRWPAAGAGGCVEVLVSHALLLLGLAKQQASCWAGAVPQFEVQFVGASPSRSCHRRTPSPATGCSTSPGCSCSALKC